MLFSIFTPTHRPQFIDRLRLSIEAQTEPNWEWVIVPNGGAQVHYDNSNIRVIPHVGPANIGRLKRFACQQSRGDVLVEADHDDELFPNALAELAATFSDDRVDFAYSNCCDVRQDYVPRTFGAEHGWRSRPCNFRGRNLLELVSFPPDPRSFSKIWYAPNHVRAWRRSFYERIGGHNPTLDILDDHDLLCRTYIAARRIVHIDKPLYVYHLHAENTCYGQRNQRIQTGTLDMHDRYIYPMVQRWCEINGLSKIDLCGKIAKPPGYFSVDLDDADIVADLNSQWPFEPGLVGVFRAHDALEHLKDPIHVMKEAYRCLAPNAWFLTQTPSTDGRGAFQDPTHVSFWNSNSFWYYCKREQAKYIGTPVRFQLNRVKNFYPSDWHKLHQIVYVKADLVKFDGRTPGLVEI